MTSIELLASEFLTEYESRALRLTFEGHTAKSAAHVLCLSKRTVQSHLNKMHRTMDMHNALQGVVLA